MLNKLFSIIKKLFAIGGMSSTSTSLYDCEKIFDVVIVRYFFIHAVTFKYDILLSYACLPFVHSTPFNDVLTRGFKTGLSTCDFSKPGIVSMEMTRTRLVLLRLMVQLFHASRDGILLSLAFIAAGEM